MNDDWGLVLEAKDMLIERLQKQLAESEAERVKLSISESAFADFSAMWERRAKLWKDCARGWRQEAAGHCRRAMRWEQAYARKLDAAQLWKRLAKRLRGAAVYAFRCQADTSRALMEANQLFAQEKADNEDLRVEIAELKGELRKYEPSDAMMYRLLELNDCIREAARLIDAAAGAPGEHNVPWDEMRAWLATGTVQRAVRKKP